MHHVHIFKQEEFLTSVLPISLIVIQKMRYNCSWDHISNIFNLFRSVNLEEMSRENIVDKQLGLNYITACKNEDLHTSKGKK